MKYTKIFDFCFVFSFWFIFSFRGLSSRTNRSKYLPEKSPYHFLSAYDKM